MSVPKLVLKVELFDGKPKVTLGTGHPALLSLALQCADLEVKDIIMRLVEVNEASPILKADLDIQVPTSLVGKL